MKKSTVPLSYIQKKAKQLKKENSTLSYHQALNDASKSFGYTNFSNFKNVAKAIDLTQTAKLEAGAEFALNRQLDKIAEKQNAIRPNVEESYIRLKNEITSFRNKNREKDSIHKFFTNNSFIKDFIELFILNDSLENDEWDFITDTPYHYPEKVVVTHLFFKSRADYKNSSEDQSTLQVEGNYELFCKSIFEYSEEDVQNCNEGFFNDESIEGSFEITIEANSKVIVDYF